MLDEIPVDLLDVSRRMSKLDAAWSLHIGHRDWLTDAKFRTRIGVDIGLWSILSDIFSGHSANGTRANWKDRPSEDVAEEDHCYSDTLRDGTIPIDNSFVLLLIGEATANNSKNTFSNRVVSVLFYLRRIYIDRDRSI